jgi:hypothetical protein
VTCWDVITGRITEDEVQYPTPEAQAAEERARARIVASGTELRDRGEHLKH